MDNRPRVAQHIFGTFGNGGPVGALNRILRSPLRSRYNMRVIEQDRAAGGVDIALLFRMAVEIRKFKPDLVHVRGLGNEGFHGALAARLGGARKVLVSLHGSARDLVEDRHGLRTWLVGAILEPLTLRMASHVVLVCEAARVKEVLTHARHKVVGVVPNGVDIELQSESRRAWRQSHNVSDRDVVIVSVGRLAKDKNNITILRAVAQLPSVVQETIVLVIAGNGPEMPRLVKFAKERLEGVRVLFLGLVPKVDEVLSAADIFVSASLHENLSNALLEAMSVGLPVAVSSVGGNVEVVSGNCGLLFGPRDTSALCVQLESLIVNGSLRKELGESARQRIFSSYTMNHMTSKLDSVYSQILADDPRG